MDGVTAERWSGRKDWERRTGTTQSGCATNHEKHRRTERRTEPNEGGRFSEALPAYSASSDDARIFNARPEPTARPPGASGPGGRQARAGDEKPVRRAERDGDVEDDPGMTVHGTLGAGLERRRRDVDTEQLIAERVHGTDARLQGGKFTARGEGRIGGKGEGTGWDRTIQPRGVVW